MHARAPEARIGAPFLHREPEQALDLRAEEGVAHAALGFPDHAIDGLQQPQEALAHFHQHLLGDIGHFQQHALAAEHPVGRIGLGLQLQTHPAVATVREPQTEHRHTRA